MLIGSICEQETPHMKFISYTGKYPNLCSGDLTLEIDGKEYVFGSGYRSHADFSALWHTTGSCGFINNYADSYINSGEWEVYIDEIPEVFKKYAQEIDMVFNNNVPYGCCGGCL